MLRHRCLWSAKTTNAPPDGGQGCRVPPQIVWRPDRVFMKTVVSWSWCGMSFATAVLGPVDHTTGHAMQNHQQATSHVWDVDGLEYHGKIWGPADGIPMLALHGWMDHCESFDVLAPLLTGCRIVAIDLSGQGLSSHRAPHASYNIWDDLPQIAAIMDQLGWSDCVLLGHSRGAIMATMFAAALPERVRAVVALDALLPEPTEFTTPDTLRAFIEQTARQKQKPPR